MWYFFGIVFTRLIIYFFAATLNKAVTAHKKRILSIRL